MATIATIREIAYRQTFQDAGFSAGMDKAAEAARKMGRETEQASGKVREAGPTLAQVNARLDENARLAERVAAATRRYTAEVERLRLERMKGQIDDERQAELERRAAIVRDNAISKANQHAEATRRMFGATAEGAAMSRQQVQQLIPQFNDLFVQISSGQGVLMPLIQQGPQITQIFGGVRSTLAAFATALGPVRIAVAAGTVALAGFAAIANSADGNLRDLSNRLRVTRNDYGDLARTVDDVAKRVAASSNISSGDARTAALGAASQRGFAGTAAELERLVRISGDVAAAFGEDVPAAMQRLTGAMKSPTDAARQLAESGLRTMNEGLLRTIERLENSGNRAEAARLTIDALARATAGAGANISPLAAAWSSLVDQFQRASQTLAPFAATVLTPIVNTLAEFLRIVRELDEYANNNPLGRLLGLSADPAAPGAAAPGQGSALENAMRIVREQGNRGRSREDINDRITALRAGLPGASREDAAAIRATIGEQREALQGLRGPVAEYLDDLRKQAALSQVAEGAARAFAEAERELAEKHASAGDQAEARRLIQARLNEDLYQASIAYGRQSTANEQLADATERGGAALIEAQIATRAQAEALKFAERGTEEYDATVRVLTADLTTLARSEQAVKDAQALRTQGNTLEMLQKEIDLVTASAQVRERELAAARELQKIVSEGGDANNLTARQQQRVSTARQIAETTSELQRQQAAMQELQQIGERAFDRVGNAITEAFTQGKAAAIDFGSIAKGIVASIATDFIRLATLAPLRNAIFGTNLPTLGTVGGVVGGLFGGFGGVGGGTAAAASAGGSIDPLAAMSLGRSLGGMSGASTGGWFGGVGNWVNSTLATPVYTVGGSAIPAGPAFYGEGMAAGQAGLSSTGGTTVSLGGALAGGASVLGGAYGVYSGLQRGGPGGYTSAAGGAVGVAGGLASLGAFGTGLMALGPYGMVAAAVLAIIGSLLPGAKPSNMTGTAAIDLASGGVDVYGQTGAKFSSENRAQAQQMIAAVEGMATTLQTTLGARPGGRVTADVGNRDGFGLRIITPNTGDTGNLGFARDEAGQAEFMRTAAMLMLQEVVPSLSSTLQKAIGGMPKATAEEILTGLATLGEATQGGQLSANQAIAGANIDFTDFAAGIGELRWVRDVYENLVKAAEPVSAFQAQLDALAATWNDAISHAARLGLATDSLSAQFGKATTELWEARNQAVADSTTSLYVRLARATGNAQGADLGAFDMGARQEREAYAAQLKAWGLTAEETASRMALIEQVHGAERLEILRGYAEEAARIEQDAANARLQAEQSAAQSAAGIVANLGDYLRGLRGGAGSPLSARGQYDAASRDFSAVLGAAQAGDARSLSSLTGYADSFLAASRAVYGSGAGYAADFGRVVDAVGTIANRDPGALTAEFMASEMRTQTAVLTDELVKLRGEVSALRREVALNGSAPARAA